MLPLRAVAVFLVPAFVISIPKVQSADDGGVEEGEWGEWSSWSSCTVDCGVGLTVRSRRCQHPAMLPFAQLLSREDSSVECAGADKEIKVCNKQACSGGPASLREKECAKYRTSVQSEHNYTWEPFIHPSDPCRLSCRARGHHFYANLADRVVDGTPCRARPPAPAPSVCMDSASGDGASFEVGCDDVLESPWRKDACGVCKGDNSTCRSISGIFTRLQLGRGATKVITIPPGATNINITELRPSNNTLALQLLEDGNYFVNPEGLTLSSGNYEGAGTIFSYEKSTLYCPGQCILAIGPTDRPVNLMMLSKGPNLGILYSFNVPLSVNDNYFRRIIYGANNDDSTPPPSDLTATPSPKLRSDDKSKKASSKTQGIGERHEAAAVQDPSHSDMASDNRASDTAFETSEEEVNHNQSTAASLDGRTAFQRNRRGGRVMSRRSSTTATTRISLSGSPTTPDSNRDNEQEQDESEDEMEKGDDRPATQTDVMEADNKTTVQAPGADQTQQPLPPTTPGNSVEDSDSDASNEQAETTSMTTTVPSYGVITLSPSTERHLDDDGVQARANNESVFKEPRVEDSSPAGTVEQSNSSLPQLPEMAKNISMTDKDKEKNKDSSRRGGNDHQTFPTPSPQRDSPSGYGSRIEDRRHFRRPHYSQSFTFRRRNQQGSHAAEYGEVSEDHFATGREPARGRAAEVIHSPIRRPPSEPAVREDEQRAAQSRDGARRPISGQQQQRPGSHTVQTLRTVQVAVRPKYEPDRDPRGPLDRQQWPRRTQALGQASSSDDGVESPNLGRTSSGGNGLVPSVQKQEVVVTPKPEAPSSYDRRQEEYRRELLRRRQLYEQQLAAQEAEYQRRLQEHNRRLREHQQRMQDRAQQNNHQRQQHHYHQQQQQQQHRRRHQEKQHNAGREGSHSTEVNVDGVAASSHPTGQLPAVSAMLVPSSGITRGAEDSKKVGRDSSVSEPDDSQAERKDGSSTTDGGQFRTIPPPSVDPRTGRQPFVPTQAPVYGSQAGFVGRSAAAPQFVANERRQDGSPSRASLTAHYDNDNKVPTFSASTLGRGDDNLVPSLVEGRRGEETEEGEGRIDNNFLGSSSYEWRVSGLTDCTLTCGGGLQQTAVVCLHTRTRAVVTDENCSQLQRPRSKAITCNTRPCPAEWQRSEWSQCSATCGPGEQTRTLTCMARISGTLNLTMPDSNCDTIIRPEGRRVCQNSPCNTWRIGNWSECSCGEGLRTREVQCIEASGLEVADTLCPQTRPATEERCDMEPCGKGWYFAEWPEQCPASCGSSAMTRPVICLGEEGGLLPDSSCDKQARPAHSKPCRTEAPCGGEWFTGEWEQCTATCGSGVRSRDVVCMKALPGGFLSIVGEENCAPNDKPTTTQSCDQLPPCSPQWYMTSWSECSVTCGTGQKTREVKCLDVQQNPSSDCSQAQKPRRVESCNMKSCDVPTAEPGAASGDCRDAIARCELVRKARMCRYPYYQKKCCATCSQETQ
ncbi:uncharacterized protein LOC112554480 [Pomacea canaliculata]|uniref:uncharacterized protein LOC112554480 n=1 Tax=Pomacea canaliculata TaxID=400727 RepID=UPI000D729AF0|nr:uncharacterized protein LOC112554480 [Pomacea canaliculata]